MANFFDVFKQVLDVLPADKAGELIGSLKSDNELIAQVNSLLITVQNEPEAAGDVARQIIAMRGVPGVVRDMVQQLPRAAKDPSGVSLTMLVTSIQSQMSQRRGWFG